MITVGIEGIEGVERLLSEAPKRLPSAIVRGLNDTANHARAESVRRICAEWAVKPAAARKALTIRRASAARQEAAVEAVGGRGYGIPLVSFGARQTRRGVTYRLKKAGGRNLVKGAFLATMRSGHRGVFVRKGKARLPIAEKRAISIMGMWQDVIDAVSAEAQPYLEARLRYHVSKELER